MNQNKTITRLAMTLIVLTIITTISLSACSPKKKDLDDNLSSSSDTSTTTIEAKTSIVEVTDVNGETVTDVNGEAATQIVEVITKTEIVTKANSGDVTPPTAPPKPVTTTKAVTPPPVTKPPTTNVPTTEKRVTASNVGAMRKELQAYAESLGMIWEPWFTSETGSWIEPLNTASFTYDRTMELCKRRIKSQSEKGKTYIHISIEPNGEHYLAYTLTGN